MSLSIPPFLGFLDSFLAMDEEGGLSKPIAVLACMAMALLYVAILYAPVLVLRLPPPSSFNNYMVRRFICAIISSILSLFVSALILHVCLIFLVLTLLSPLCCSVYPCFTWVLLLSFHLFVKTWVAGTNQAITLCTCSLWYSSGSYCKYHFLLFKNNNNENKWNVLRTFNIIFNDLEILKGQMWTFQCVNFKLHSCMLCRLENRVTHSFLNLLAENAIFCMKQWQAVVIPLSLTSLMYAGSIFLKCLLLLDSWRQHRSSGGGLSFDSFKNVKEKFLGWFFTTASNVLVWRNCIVVSIFTC